MAKTRKVTLKCQFCKRPFIGSPNGVQRKLEAHYRRAHGDHRAFKK